MPEILQMLRALQCLARLYCDGHLGQLLENGAGQDLVQVSIGDMFNMFNTVLRMDVLTIKCHYGMHVHFELYCIKEEAGDRG